jgi:hypothetical protein
MNQSKLPMVAVLLVVLAACEASTPITSLPNSTPSLTSSQATEPTLIDINFENKLYDYNDELMDSLNNNIEVTKVYKLMFDLQVKPAYVNLLPKLPNGEVKGIDSRITIQFADEELFKLNKNRLTGTIGGRTTMLCTNNGSNEINCAFTLTEVAVDTDDFFIEISAPSRLNTVDDQRFELSIETLSRDFEYRIGSIRGSKVTMNFDFNLVRTSYSLKEPELYFLQTFGLTRVFLPIGLGENDLKYQGFKPGTNQVVIPLTTISTGESDTFMDVNFFDLYVISIGNNLAFAQNNAVEIKIIYSQNVDYFEASHTVILDYQDYVS